VDYGNAFPASAAITASLRALEASVWELLNCGLIEHSYSIGKKRAGSACLLSGNVISGIYGLGGAV
jgi:hypothetical protein